MGALSAAHLVAIYILVQGCYASSLRDRTHGHLTQHWDSTNTAASHDLQTNKEFTQQTDNEDQPIEEFVAYTLFPGASSTNLYYGPKVIVKRQVDSTPTLTEGASSQTLPVPQTSVQTPQTSFSALQTPQTSFTAGQAPQTSAQAPQTSVQAPQTPQTSAQIPQTSFPASQIPQTSFPASQIPHTSIPASRPPPSQVNNRPGNQGITGLLVDAANIGLDASEQFASVGDRLSQRIRSRINRFQSGIDTMVDAKLNAYSDLLKSVMATGVKFPTTAMRLAFAGMQMPLDVIG